MTAIRVLNYFKIIALCMLTVDFMCRGPIQKPALQSAHLRRPSFTKQRSYTSKVCLQEADRVIADAANHPTKLHQVFLASKERLVQFKRVENVSIKLTPFKGQKQPR